MMKSNKINCANCQVIMQTADCLVGFYVPSMARIAVVLCDDCELAVEKTNIFFICKNKN